MYEKWWLAKKDEEISCEKFLNLDSKQGTLSRIFTEIYSREYCIHAGSYDNIFLKQYLIRGKAFVIIFANSKTNLLF